MNLSRPTLDHKVDGLLSQWHDRRAGYQHTRGFSGSDATCRDFQTPSHQDWWNGAEDDRADDLVTLAVERAIARIPNTPRRWRTVIEFEARNLHSRANVWRSPVLPTDAGELEVLRMEARNQLLRELQREGVVT
ncbi:hypothetical protein [Variovorax sp. PAMC 28711]|uniref:hypothetical protein n=1 Tax=Variovorax sp. PAMC 28711 TaxID=1795631 RepID=UPI00078B74BD|nr:hypothetical protein [Variovorax sp. PAMC 28711]AMM23006.1 hypothetical protein AX767_00375 [Variovorax sp. PAMC 28711]